MSCDFVAKRAPDIFIVIAEKFPKALKEQMESWNKTKDQFLNSVNSGTYERAGRYKNFFEALFHQILMFRKSFCTQIHTLTQLKKDYTKKVRSKICLLHLLNGFFVIEPLEFFARIFEKPWMKERLLQGDYVELKYALRFFGKRSTMSANLETIIGDVHDIARDPQRNHMFIYQMENELVVKQLYHNVDIYSHDF